MALLRVVINVKLKPCGVQVSRVCDMNKPVLKVGDSVMWRGGFGRDKAQQAVVKTIELCEDGEKYGTPVDEVDTNLLHRVVVDLDNGHWAYGDQITRIL